MKKSSNSFVAGALTAIVGVALGAGSVLSAQLAFNGMNPNEAQKVERKALDGTRRDIRKDQDSTTNAYDRDAHDSQHNAASDKEGWTYSQAYLLDRCEKLFGPRETAHSRRGLNCFAAADDGEMFDPQ